MKLRHAAALALAAWLLLLSQLRAAGGAVAVPGTADVKPPGWLLLQPPLCPLPIPSGSPPGVQTFGPDTTAPLLRWKIVKTFPTEKECHAQAGNTWVELSSSPG
jgi:hypothetical protein